jgi:hypothetical protein
LVENWKWVKLGLVNYANIVQKSSKGEDSMECLITVEFVIGKRKIGHAWRTVGSHGDSTYLFEKMKRNKVTNYKWVFFQNYVKKLNDLIPLDFESVLLGNVVKLSPYVDVVVRFFQNVQTNAKFVVGRKVTIMFHEEVDCLNARFDIQVVIHAFKIKTCKFNFVSVSRKHK